MTLRFAFAAPAALAVATAAAAAPPEVPPRPDTVLLDLGFFMNVRPGQIYYDGAFPTYVHAASPSDAPDRTQIKIDLWGIVSSLDYDAIVSITVTDTGRNSYGALSPGADVDLMRLINVGDDLGLTFDYEGPSPIHGNESAHLLALRVANIDSFSGHQDAWHRTHVSLADGGSLTLRPSELLVDAASIVGRPKLLLSEAGSLESFRVSMEVVVPAPGTPALLLLAAFARRRRRRVPRAACPLVRR